MGNCRKLRLGTRRMSSRFCITLGDALSGLRIEGVSGRDAASITYISIYDRAFSLADLLPYSSAISIHLTHPLWHSSLTFYPTLMVQKLAHIDEGALHHGERHAEHHQDHCVGRNELFRNDNITSGYTVSRQSTG